MIQSSVLFKIIVFSFCIFDFGHCWVSEEMQMFDLVEELKENFYDFLGVSKVMITEYII